MSATRHKHGCCADSFPPSVLALKKHQHLRDSQAHLGISFLQKILSFRPGIAVEGRNCILRKVVVVVGVDIISELAEKVKRLLCSRGGNAKDSYGRKHWLKDSKTASKESDINPSVFIAAKVTRIVAIDDSIKRPRKCACCIPELRKHQKRRIPSLRALRLQPIALRRVEKTNADYDRADRSDCTQPISQVCLLHSSLLRSGLVESTYTSLVENARG
ncbi:hypothetical protein O0I63_01545 [Stenotrophomonas sp. Sm8]|uniref:hypothetical protein n=1 Tax=Stenotrophomonas sp. Sm8 TaxID=3002753 RepID=UPI0027E45297|nr:hypothetical protein [Stenotrophomonas sp. Sm8]MDQ7314008.1 hypothetical protein [Stenotrophomonas sp. Sm8]